MGLPAANHPLLELNVSISGAGDNVVIANAIPSSVIFVYKIFLVVASAVNVTFKDGAATPVSGSLPMLANGSIVLDFDGYPWFKMSVGNSFVINLSAPVPTTGRVYYTQHSP